MFLKNQLYLFKVTENTLMWNCNLDGLLGQKMKSDIYAWDWHWEDLSILLGRPQQDHDSSDRAMLTFLLCLLASAKHVDPGSCCSLDIYSFLDNFLSTGGDQCLRNSHKNLTFHVQRTRLSLKIPHSYARFLSIWTDHFDVYMNTRFW